MVRPSRLGFSMFELLVVLVLVSVASSVVAPNLWQAYQKAAERRELYDYAHEFLDLRRELYQGRRGIELSQDQLTRESAPDGVPAVPSGWVLQGHTRIAFLPNGVCSGGEFVFGSPSDRRWKLEFAPLDAQPGIELL